MKFIVQSTWKILSLFMKNKILLITNIPTPYRLPIFKILNEQLNIKFVFCSKIEKNRSWKIDKRQLNINHTFLSKNKNYVHTNPGIFKLLHCEKPNIIITSGFYPTMIFAFLYSLIFRIQHIVFTDGTLDSESRLTIFHMLVRKVFFRYSKSFIAASDKSISLFESYGINRSKIYKSHLCVDNLKFNSNKKVKKYDLMFSGQFIERKNPIFFVNLFQKLNEIGIVSSAIMIGDGPLLEKTISYVKENDLNIKTPGFIQQDQLPEIYQQSSIFIFPSSNDPWGLVANEALASGLPVLVSKFAGCSDELVIDGYNGFVFDNFDLNTWIEKIKYLLSDTNLLNKFSDNSKKSVTSYNYNNAAQGIISAIKHR